MKSVVVCIFLAGNIVSAQSHQSSMDKKSSGFQWPEGKRMALSLTFDDARPSQVKRGIPLLDRYGVKATFYVVPNNVLRQLDGWKEAVKNGHDIGNHTVRHPCTGNYTWSRRKALEDYTLEDMMTELDSANRFIEEYLGVTPVSFCYPCHNTYVGRGINTTSYIPVIAMMFETGRGGREVHNDPVFCDMHQLQTVRMDGLSFEEIKELIESKKYNGRWLILCGHDVSKKGTRQTTLLSTLEEICKYATDPSNGIWIDNVHNIATYVKEQRGEAPFTVMPVYKNPLYSLEQRIDDLLPRMSLEEKIGQINMPKPNPRRFEKMAGSEEEGMERFIKGNLMDGMGPGGGFFAYARSIDQGAAQQAKMINRWQKTAVENTRLGIPLLLIEEGTHGAMFPWATIYPEGPSLGSSWNMNLIKEVYSQAACEARSVGTHALNTIVIEPILDARLGRNEEAYTEDTYLSARIAKAIVDGAQGKDLTASDKVVVSFCHYPGQSLPVSGLERGAMEISERMLRKVFLPPWEAGITEGGALSVMATYPSIDDVPAHASHYLLTEILRNELGFEGIVLCEGGGIGTLIYEKIVPGMKEAGILNLKAGVDVSIWWEQGYMGLLRESVEEGLVSMATLDQAVHRVLRVKYRLGLFDNPYVDEKKAAQVIHATSHRKTALQAAREGIVLLKNEGNLLPLDKGISSIAVIGPNADRGYSQLGDYFVAPVHQEVVTVLQGIKEQADPGTRIKYVRGCDLMGNEVNDLKEAAAAARRSDVAIVVLGESRAMCGEGKNVVSLDLMGLQEDLLKAVYETGTPTILVLINGRPLSIRWSAENIPAIVEAWLPGEKGGTAVAEILYGDYNPDGRLPVTFPRHVGQLPAYYNHKPSKEYFLKRWGDYVDMPATPLYHFGHGLSYTSFEYRNLMIEPQDPGPGNTIRISLDVRNTGDRCGGEVVQLYINDVISSLSTPVIELKGFEKIWLEPGEKQNITFSLTPKKLALLDRNMDWVVEPGVFEVMVGHASNDIRLKGEFEIR